ncbi:efflux transporter outer membrane subunit [Sphingomonas sp.]|jgi:multidrug efflux system outer membrane protein|uniref:efflux transporter outer membrane subunit n=1 Tax=Sphingomonas sp. TaxID=28214 RepID=UPI002D804BF7|nr:efflux transporter outer membrane subunit [Sphingomonas sp.]HEU0044353.1 efflux transporter outer membrane subunit [Sphingomonas sp.]
MNRPVVAAIALAALSGCSLAPKYVQPALPVPTSWPVGDAYLRQSEAALPSVTYAQVFADPRLQQLIARALVNNRDLRVAVANIEAARAQYRIQRAERLPRVDTGADYSLSRSGGGNANTTGIGGSVSSGGGTNSRFSVDVGVTAFEIDLFGRIRSLTGAALDRYFATEAAARATRLTLVGDIADAWLQLAADRSLLRLAQQTVTVSEQSVRLTRARLQGGVSPRTDLAQAEQILATAQADVAEQTTAVAQDRNALELLVGAPVEAPLLPMSIDEAAPRIVALPAGVDSSVLLRRPDVVQAEYQLRAANGDIGAARAALFPRLSLTGVLGFASNALTSLFSGGAFNFSAGPSIGYNIFSAGAGRANVALTQAQRDAALATYERSIQIAFRETADALARQGTIEAQIAANRRFVAAAADTQRLTEARYRGGIDTFLASLDAQRSLYAAQRTLVSTGLVGASNRVALYRALGGDSTLAALSPTP